MKFISCHCLWIISFMTLIFTQSPTILGVQFDKVQSSDQGQLVASNYSLESASSVRDKRQNGQARTLDFLVGPGPPASLCFEREVYGTCRYRTAPDECFRHEWTAYATIITAGVSKVTSHPGDLVVHPGPHPRVRVFVKTSCCNPIVEFIAWDLFLQQQVCIVDVRELQDLHPGEIAGIVVGVLLFIIIVIAIIACCVRRRRLQKERQTIIFGRSLTRSKSRSESINPTLKP